MRTLWKSHIPHLIDLIKNGKSLKEMSSLYQVPLGTVGTAQRRHGVRIRDLRFSEGLPQTSKATWLHKRDEMLQYARAGKSAKEIARIYGKSTANVYTALKNNGISLRFERHHNGVSNGKV